LTPGAGIPIRHGKKSKSEMNIPDYFSKSLKTVFSVKNIKFCDADPESF
jgi:hypothetical protein